MEGWREGGIDRRTDETIDGLRAWDAFDIPVQCDTDRRTEEDLFLNNVKVGLTDSTRGCGVFIMLWGY